VPVFDDEEPPHAAARHAGEDAAQGLVGSDAYLEQWRWGEVEERGEPVEAIVAELAAAFRS